MEKNTKLLIGALFVLIVASVLFKGEITGKAVICSDAPKFVKVEPIGDSISMSWTETSTLKGAQMRYEISLYRQKQDGTYDFGNPDETDIIPDGYGSFNELEEVNYIVRVRAMNKQGYSCPDYSGYATSEEVFIDKSKSGRAMP